MKGSLVIYITSIIALSVLLNPLSVLSQSTPKISCSAYMKCSQIADTSYGLIDGVCRIFRNPCLLAFENCDREARNESLIIPTTKEKCTPRCPNMCPMYISPICGEYVKERRTFNNECEMERYSCKNGKSFRLLSQGQCQSIKA
ncbi:U-Kazal-Dg21.2-like [Episyrphus balteatus]|uniref:U-Kazal-Dg21.2-like n=1 Tax=Episyrphus balteatus TaxID=286459 RepID=UPI00248541BC|nr:U-Kazal-Dg21.2-like [Episyrphus balteatus]